KPVEVNALWFNALTAMTAFARRLGQPDDAYAEMARRVGHAFERFWNGETGCLYDVIDGPQGPDPAVRPNQIFTVSLPDTPRRGAPPLHGPARDALGPAHAAPGRRPLPRAPGRHRRRARSLGAPGQRMGVAAPALRARPLSRARRPRRRTRRARAAR